MKNMRKQKSAFVKQKSLYSKANVASNSKYIVLTKKQQQQQQQHPFNCVSHAGDCISLISPSISFFFLFFILRPLLDFPFFFLLRSLEDHALLSLKRNTQFKQLAHDGRKVLEKLVVVLCVFLNIRLESLVLDQSHVGGKHHQ
jgi:hypothetical protein